VHNIAQTWQQAAVLASALFVLAYGLHRAAGPARRAWPFARETGLIAALYAIWQLVGSLSVVGTHGAFARGRWIVRVEHWLHLPRERSVQEVVLPHPVLAQFCNLYYASMHFAGLFGLLLWLFVRHREAYPRVRATIVGLTLSCLVIQFLPVAPPRLVPQADVVDVAARYGQSVYGTFGGTGADQLSAMPSVHVGWAVLVGLVIVRVSSSRWRWLFLLHPLITVFVVIATGNHYWLDGIVAVVLLALVESAQHGWELWQARRRDTTAAQLLAA
jgi:hypothetical protein